MWLPVVGHHCHQKLVTDETGDAGASLPDVTALVFASVSSDDFRQVGLGCAQAGRPCAPCWTRSELESLTGVAKCQCSRNGGFSGPPWGQSVVTAFFICAGKGMVQWLCRLRLDDGPGGGGDAGWDKRTKALDVLCAEGQ